MEIILGVLSFLVTVLVVLQGREMLSNRHNINNKTNNPTAYLDKLDTIIGKLGRMEQRLNDIWDKVKEG